MGKRFYFIAALFLGVLCCAQMAHGQATGSFLGVVTDKSGSAISGAKITVTSQATGTSRDAVTDDAGHYAINLLPVSVYTVRVDYQGLQPVETKDVKLQVNEQRELDFALSPSSVTTSVEVVASEVQVDAASSSLGQVITAQEVAQLPLNGGNFVQLATLTPGATAESNPNSFFTSSATSEVAARGSFSLSVGGSRPNAKDWLLQGVVHTALT